MAACHIGGYNQVRPEKTLQELVLRQNGMLAADAIEYQVINGKNRMPAFEGRLSEDEITNVAFYVVAQAQAVGLHAPTAASMPLTSTSCSLLATYWR